MEPKDITSAKQQIKEFVNKADPWHLIEMGAPDDEYNSQTDRITSLVINNKPDQSKIESELYIIFKTNEHELEKDLIQELARNIASIN